MRKDKVFCSMVRAGSRTYYFDVKENRGTGRYITTTESKRKFDENGNSVFDRHKIFLYHEDFDNFVNGLTEAINQSRTIPPKKIYRTESAENDDPGRFSNVDFDELGNR